MKINFAANFDGNGHLATWRNGPVLSETTATLDAEAGGVLSTALERLSDPDKPNGTVELAGIMGLPARVSIHSLSDDPDGKSVEVYAAGAVKAASGHGAKSLAIDAMGLDPMRVAGGAMLAGYRFERFKQVWLDKNPAKRFSLTEVTVLCPDPAQASEDWAVASGPYEGANWARDLINLPPNLLTPSAFARECEALKDAGVEVVVLDEVAMAELGMNLLLGVGAGSAEESKLVAMVWRGGGDEPFTALVGKGITFDTGGISIKPALSMEEMKCDMGGAAAVVGAMLALAHRKAAANVVGVIALAENMPDARAQRPSDIVTSMSGQTVEIINTDAEGRLVLADALTWVQRTYAPKRIVDLATLTGAIIMSLGHHHAGAFSNSDALFAALNRAGEATGETLWRMPLDLAYDKLMDSDFADMKNAYVKNAGAITAAQFLKRFVAEDVDWVHLDIAGVATRPVGDDPRFPVWATGWGPRLLDQLIRELEVSQ
jgi:leucyl aminopeptidase